MKETEASSSPPARRAKLELLVRHIGKAKGIELVRLSRIPSAPGIAQAAIDALAAAFTA